MKKVIRLTESDLVRIVKRVIKENGGRNHETTRLNMLNENWGNYLKDELQGLKGKPLEYFETRFGDYNFSLARIGKNEYTIKSVEDINGVNYDLGRFYTDENDIIGDVYIPDEDLYDYLRTTFKGSRKYDEQDIYYEDGRWEMKGYDYYTKKKS
jgi:hypothetical protein